MIWLETPASLILCVFAKVLKYWTLFSLWSISRPCDSKNNKTNKKKPLHRYRAIEGTQFTPFINLNICTLRELGKCFLSLSKPNACCAKWAWIINPLDFGHTFSLLSAFLMYFPSPLQISQHCTLSVISLKCKFDLVFPFHKFL